MGKSGPSAPDPKETAAAQTATNVSTAIANSFLNNHNQVTPYGNLNYDVTGKYKWTDPVSGNKYNIPRLTVTQSLTPDGQVIQDNTIDTQKNLSGTASVASNRLQDMLGRQINLNNAPQAAEVPDYMTSYGPQNYGQARTRVENAIMRRAQPGLDQDRQALEARLADQGIEMGSAAYQAAMGDYGRQVNDMRTSAILAGGQEQSRIAGLARDRATFNNQAQAQQYQTQNAARDQYLQEAYTNRNQGLNEILSLMSGSQIQNPNFMPGGNNNIATTDYAGLVQQDYANRLQSHNDMWGGLLGLGGSIAQAGIPLLSDERAKTDIKKVGKTDDGQKVYSYRYKHEGKAGPIHMGLMAQEVEKKKPQAVTTGKDGLKRVNYGIALGK
jgi:hypothetical protein